jgi:hypothetical protein
MLVEQQRRDQETREDKEQIDPEKATGDPRNAEVVGQHQCDRHTARSIERRDVREGCGDPRGGAGS